MKSAILLRKLIIILITLLTALFLASCATQVGTPEVMVIRGVTSKSSPTFSPTGTITSSPSATPSPTLQLASTEESKPTRTPRPTLSSSQVENFFEIFHNDTCRLPCYLGMVPGQTKFNDANKKLESMGATIFSVNYNPFQNELLGQYKYLFDIDGPTGHVTQAIYLHVYKGIVFRMGVHFTSAFHQIFYEHWSKYSIPTLLEKFGVPNDVYVVHNSSKEIQVNGNDVWVAYNEMGLFLGNQGLTRRDNLVCPGVREGITNSIFMELFDPEFSAVLTASSQFDYISVYNFQEEGGFPKVKVRSALPIETALGIEPNQLYEEMMQDPFFCFERVIQEE